MRPYIKARFGARVHGDGAAAFDAKGGSAGAGSTPPTGPGPGGAQGLEMYDDFAEMPAMGTSVVVGK